MYERPYERFSKVIWKWLQLYTLSLGEKFDRDEWVFYCGRKDIPKQKDTHNCGAFTILLAVAIYHRENYTKVDTAACEELRLVIANFLRTKRKESDCLSDHWSKQYRKYLKSKNAILPTITQSSGVTVTPTSKKKKKGKDLPCQHDDLLYEGNTSSSDVQKFVSLLVEKFTGLKTTDPILPQYNEKLNPKKRKKSTTKGKNSKKKKFFSDEPSKKTTTISALPIPEREVKKYKFEQIVSLTAESCEEKIYLN